MQKCEHLVKGLARPKQTGDCLIMIAKQTLTLIMRAQEDLPAGKFFLLKPLEVSIAPLGSLLLRQTCRNGDTSSLMPKRCFLSAAHLPLALCISRIEGSWKGVFDLKSAER